MQEYAEKERLLTQLRRMLISSFELTNGTIIIPLLLFYFELGILCTKVYRLVEYTPVKSFSNFLQSVVNGRRQEDQNPNYITTAETMKLLANSSSANQIMDRSRHSVTRYKIDEKTHAVINKKMFKRLGHINDQLCKVELAKLNINN